MKDTLQSQLETYKRDNTKSSKSDMLSTINSISSSSSDSLTLRAAEQAKSSLTASRSNKNTIVESVEDLISSLS